MGIWLPSPYRTVPHKPTFFGLENTHFLFQPCPAMHRLLPFWLPASGASSKGFAIIKRAARIFLHLTSPPPMAFGKSISMFCSFFIYIRVLTLEVPGSWTATFCHRPSFGVFLSTTTSLLYTVSTTGKLASSPSGEGVPKLGLHIFSVMQRRTTNVLSVVCFLFFSSAFCSELTCL